jgi:hypothetical protein
MTKNPSLTRKTASLQEAVGDLRKRVAILSSFLLEEGVSVKSYRQLQILHGELGCMPELPAVEADGKVYLRDTEEACSNFT